VTHSFATRQIPFFLTAPSPCPYLSGRWERKVFTRLEPAEGPALNDALTHAGFRRSQSVLYRPACESCDACRSVRIDVANFQLNKRWNRILKRNGDLRREERDAEATAEQYALFRTYLESRHGDGDMAGMSFGEYVMMAEDGAQRTHIGEYRDPADRLVAAALTDTLKDGISLVYSFFDPDMAKRSLGAFMILDAVRQASDLGLPYVYLGYWVKGSAKMDYKADYQPLQLLTPGGWREFAEAANQDAEDGE
jgi:arginine-tRNA-protein transferase